MRKKLSLRTAPGVHATGEAFRFSETRLLVRFDFPVSALPNAWGNDRPF
jgi:hypothetical protein